jgi:hypothetical protein
VKRAPEPDLPMPRASLPEGCSDLIDAYKIRVVFEKARSRFILRMAALLHDAFVAQLDPEILCTRNEELLRQCISDFLHPILLANPRLEKRLEASSDLVETLFHVVMANADDGKT